MMIPMSFRALPGLLLATCMLTAQADDKLADYGWTMPVQISGKQGVVSLTLPKEVYLNARSPGLRDVRIFDANGKPVPAALYLPAPPGQALHARISGKMFAVAAPDKRPGGEHLDLDIQTNDNGNVVSVKTRGAGLDNKLQNLILDFGPQGENPPWIDALHFGVPTPATSAPAVAGANNYQAEVWLETSMDLKQWESVGGAELAWLSNAANDQLANDRFQFSPRHFRYARLSWRVGTPATFASVDAETVTTIAPSLAMDSLAISPRPGARPNEWVYPLARTIPVRRVGVQPNGENWVFAASLGHYRTLPSYQVGQSERREFESVTEVNFYQITVDGKTRRQDAIEVPPGHSQEWVLRTSSQDIAAPVLRVEWQPEHLLFVTSGTAPYTLAFGRDARALDKLSPPMRFDQVVPGLGIAELDKLEQARLGTLQQGALLPADVARTDWRKFGLWTALLSGVLVLGLMVRSLVRQMKNDAPPDA